MKKIIALFLATLMFTAFAFVSVSAAETDPRDVYKTYYDEYVKFYDNDYVTSYNNYNKALDKLAKTVSTIDASKLESLLAFVKQLKTEKEDFFGTRKTEGKSRYLVPQLRKAMEKAYSKNDFTLAYDKCVELKAAVAKRITFLNGLTAKINDYGKDPIVPDVDPSLTDVSIVFKAKQSLASATGYDYTIVIKNNNAKEITNWNFRFLFKNGELLDPNDGRESLSLFNDEKFNLQISSLNANQNIPANGSITIYAHGEFAAKELLNPTFNGKNVKVQYSVESRN